MMRFNNGKCVDPSTCYIKMCFAKCSLSISFIDYFLCVSKFSKMTEAIHFRTITTTITIKILFNGKEYVRPFYL